MKELFYVELGATLFVPANHKNLLPLIRGEKYPYIKSLVIDFEDGLDVELMQHAEQKLHDALLSISEYSPFIFIRPKHAEHLKHIVKMKDIEKITGFILPKFSLKNADTYLNLLDQKPFVFMPSIEGEELFDIQKLVELKEKLLTNKHNIVLVRFGLEDMLKSLYMRRKCKESVFDFSVTSCVLGNFMATFKGAGFGVSGGVYPCFLDDEGFCADVERDLKEGLFSKTVIHPKQALLTNELYKVDEQEYQEAKEILLSKKAVFNQNGKMAERATMINFAKIIAKRAEIYGIKK